MDGQNVLFLDSHVEFAKRSFCSLEDDNIYTSSRNGVLDQRGDPWGVPPAAGTMLPTCRKDSVLDHDDASMISTSTGPKPRPKP
jgi:prepilin-type processing-associated H-X9-DG protein